MTPTPTCSRCNRAAHDGPCQNRAAEIEAAAREIAANAFPDPDRPQHVVYLVAAGPMDRLRAALEPK